MRHSSIFRLTISLIVFATISVPVYGQSYDVLIKGGHLIDPKNGIDEPLDIAVRADTVARVAFNIDGSEATRVIDAGGMYVTPGLIDLHVHVFFGTDYERTSDGFNALPPDGFTFRAGVTTVVDVGGSGWIDFPTFHERVIERSRTRVLSFLQIVKYGQKGTPYVQAVENMDPVMTANRARQHPGTIVGVKLAHYQGHDWEPTRRVVEAGRQADVPVMIDFGGADPPLPLETLFLEQLRPGDIYTHTFGGGRGGGREAIVDEDGQLRPFVREAQERGIIFDVGHGAGSFFYEHAIPAMEQGFRPTTISTDLYGSSMNTGMKDMLNVASKFLNLGMNMREITEATTWKPAQVIGREDLGHLSVGAVADIAVLKMREGEFGFIDNAGYKIFGDKKLEAELTLRAGRVVWDLNGIAADRWSR